MVDPLVKVTIPPGVPAVEPTVAVSVTLAPSVALANPLVSGCGCRGGHR